MRHSIGLACLTSMSLGSVALADATQTSPTPEPVTGVDTLLARPTTTAVSAALSTKEKNTEFRATFVPSQFVDTDYSFWFSELKIVALADTSTSLTRIAVSTGYNPFSFRTARGQAIIEWVNKHLVDCSAVPIGPEMEACNKRRTVAQWRILNSGWRPAISGTLSYDIYPYGTAPDPSDATKEATLESNGGPGGQVSFELRPCERARLSAWGTFKHTRPDGGVGTKQSNYLGGGATASAFVWTFLPDKDEDYPDDYVTDGFVPGVSIGGSFQAVRCEGEQACAKLRTSQWSFTPFIDVLVTSKLQLRISVPITRFSAVDKNGTEAAGTFTIAGSLGTP